MAEAQCGPSNPLQSFQKKTTADRSIQQDRLLSRAGPSQSFRSSSHQSTGLLDAEFASFQAGNLPSALLEPHAPSIQQLGGSRYAPPPPPPQLASQSPGWASDFQRLQISPSPVQVTPPQRLQQQQQQQPAQSTSWHHDFQNQTSLYRPTASNFQQFSPPQSFQQFQPYHAQNSYLHFNDPGQFVEQEPAPLEATQSDIQFDEEAFEREFQALDAALQQEEQLMDTNSVELGQDILIDGPDTLQSLDDNAMPAQVNEDIIDTKPDSNAQDVSREEDDMARTARELLQRLEDNHSDKFRDSSFLSLMAQFRDGEARVEGNQIVSVDKQSAEEISKPESTSENVIKPLKRSSSVPRRPTHSLNSGINITTAVDLPSAKDLDFLPDRPSRKGAASWLRELPRGHMIDDF